VEVNASDVSQECHWILKSRYRRKEKDEGLQRKVEMDCKRGRLMFEVLMRFIIVEGVAYGEYAYEVPSNAECMLAVAKII
jgi:hypothetical protein